MSQLNATPAGVLEVVILPLVSHASERGVAGEILIRPQACLYALHLQHMQRLTARLEACKHWFMCRLAMKIAPE